MTLRPVRDDDGEFLARVYASTRTEELAPVPWPEEQKAAFLRMQFEAQSAHYRQHYGGAEFLIIERDGTPVGRLYLHRRRDEIRVVDIALLPEHRGAGIGAALLGAVLDEAAGKGLPVRIHVEQHNSAMRLYQRLGFRRVGEYGVYDLMEWRRAPAIS